ncbi:hypothetical protein TPSea814_000534 [Treponema pallidum subsp. pallidum str. Sea 81-4]|nr:conserved hypothetical protein [Treponema pallidum subsp. pallidum str. Chicago]AHN67205.1 hypothetical protein TPSea814_000534 [Treponema pallidum subsp. pallidum str. Sea 81-4]
MERDVADVFVYAKLSGLCARLWVGERLGTLQGVGTLCDLWVRLFSEPAPRSAGAHLVGLIQRRVEACLLRDCVRAASCYQEPPSLFSALLARYDYLYLKTLSSSESQAGFRVCQPPDLGRFSLFRWEKWPCIEAVTRGSPVSWYNRVPRSDERVLWDLRLDQSYYHALWQTLCSIPEDDRTACSRLVREEVALYAVGWVLRLRMFYGVQKKDAPSELSSNGAIRRCLGTWWKCILFAWDCSLTERGAWSGWRYERFLNNPVDGVQWEPDLDAFERAGSRFLYCLARTVFHAQLFTPATIVAFFMMKRFEARGICALAECIHAGSARTLPREFLGEAAYV